MTVFFVFISSLLAVAGESLWGHHWRPPTPWTTAIATARPLGVSRPDETGTSNLRACLGWVSRKAHLFDGVHSLQRLGLIERQRKPFNQLRSAAQCIFFASRNDLFAVGKPRSKPI